VFISVNVAFCSDDSSKVSTDLRHGCIHCGTERKSPPVPVYEHPCNPKPVAELKCGESAETPSVSQNGRQWLDVYRAAVMEFDRDKLPSSIEVAEQAIHQRLRGLPIANSKEHRELRDALNSLAVLKRML
jgi:hypothetical protein